MKRRRRHRRRTRRTRALASCTNTAPGEEQETHGFVSEVRRFIVVIGVVVIGRITREEEMEPMVTLPT